MDIVKSNSKAIRVAIGLVTLAAITAWQFYLFVVFEGADGIVALQRGTVHWWVAMGLGLTTCVAGFYFISSFRGYDRCNEMHIASQGPPQDKGKRKRNA